MSLPEFTELQNGLAVIFLNNFDEQLYKSQQNFESKTNLSSTLQYFWHDLNNPISDQWTNLFEEIKDLAGRKNLEEAIIWINVENGQPTYLAHKIKPESKYNWLEVANQFEINYKNDKADNENVWAWGQIVAESGEYLCRDCGYIETFEAGNVFPVCEVCLAGDPEGPLEVSAGYWEKI